MKRKTYNNVLKAIKLIEAKGYNFNEAGAIALTIFESHENDANPIEFYIDKILSKQDWIQYTKQCKP